MPDTPTIIETPPGEHLLPVANASAIEKAMSGVDNRLLGLPHSIIRSAWDADTCPVDLLPYLAVAWSVDEWDPDWPEATKRAVIKASPEIHRLKGTKGAIRRAIESLGLGAKVEEWFEYAGLAYSFRITVRLAPAMVWRLRQVNLLWRTALKTKNVRSWLSGIVVVVPPPSDHPTIGLGLAMRTSTRLRITFDPVSQITPQRLNVNVGAVPISRIRIRFGV